MNFVLFSDRFYQSERIIRGNCVFRALTCKKDWFKFHSVYLKKMVIFFGIQTFGGFGYVVKCEKSGQSCRASLSLMKSLGRLKSQPLALPAPFLHLATKSEVGSKLRRIEISFLFRSSLRLSFKLVLFFISSCHEKVAKKLASVWLVEKKKFPPLHGLRRQQGKGK